MIIGVPRETLEGEKRVALNPDAVAKHVKSGAQVVVEAGAGEGSGISDSAYVDKGATIEEDAKAVFSKSDVVVKVRCPAALTAKKHEAEWLKEGAILISFLAPHANLDAVKRLAEGKVTSLAMELIPRVTRAQPMDALSSQANIAGYKAVLMAANANPKFWPMFMTAAGTVAPARVFVIGAGVAGLQAIATARRLGAVVEAYDTRPVVKEQVMSLGAKFVELSLETKDAQDKGGYAKEQSEEFYKKQQELMAKHVGASDAVITTAAIPGKRAPVLITEEAVKGMRPGSAIVDLAAETGGNCALTEPGKEVVKHGVTIIGYTDLPSRMAVHATQLYSRNVSSLLGLLIKDGNTNLDLNDEIIKGAMVTHNGEITHGPTRDALTTGSKA